MYNRVQRTKSPPVTKLVLKRFRSFPSATLGFDNPLFIVGQNGSGKSNLADAFSFVSEAMSSPLQAVFDRRGGIASVRNRSSVRSAPPNLGLAFEFGPINGIDGGRFAFEVKALPNYGYRIVHEQCLIRKKDGGHWWFDRTEKWKSNIEGLSPALEPSAPVLLRRLLTEAQCQHIGVGRPIRRTQSQLRGKEGVQAGVRLAQRFEP